MKLVFFFLTFLSVMCHNFVEASSNYKSISINGNYYGKNLIVINPIVNDEFAVESVIVNGITTSDEIKSSAFEIDFSLLKLNIGDTVSVNIKYKSELETPIIFNPEVIENNTSFVFSSVEIDKKAEYLFWSINAVESIEKFEVEQFRWEKWVHVAYVSPNDSVLKNVFQCKINSHNGKNAWRVKSISSNGNLSFSKPVKYSNRIPEVSMDNAKVSDKISFSASTMYQIYSDKGEKLLSGSASVIDVSTLQPGNYWINYDNKTESFKKK